jgi:predicted nucleic acid-binding protein
LAFVVDASVTLSWCFDDERHPYGQAALDALATAEAVVPCVWPLEVSNALLIAERRKRVTLNRVTEFLADIGALAIQVDHAQRSVVWSDVIRLARVNMLTIYDAAYLEVALRHGIPLATSDKALVAALAACGHPRFEPTKGVPDPVS